MLPWANVSPNAKRHLDRFSHFCTAYDIESLYFTTAATSPPLKIASSYGDLDSRPIHGSFSLGPSESTVQTASRSVQPFFAGLTTVTDRQTDRPRYSICITVGRIYVRSRRCGPIIMIMTTGLQVLTSAVFFDVYGSLSFPSSTDRSL